jgi:hypothetical protein
MYEKNYWEITNVFLSWRWFSKEFVENFISFGKLFEKYLCTNVSDKNVYYRVVCLTASKLLFYIHFHNNSKTWFDGWEKLINIFLAMSQYLIQLFTVILSLNAVVNCRLLQAIAWTIWYTFILINTMKSRNILIKVCFKLPMLVFNLLKKSKVWW